MPRLALSMIVRDAAASLRDCLASIQNTVDEIVIADTGSADETCHIARAFGARVIHIPWQDDFAQARNVALAEVTAEWVISLDADEILDPECATQLPGLIESNSVSGYQVTIRNYVLSLTDRLWDRPASPNDSRLPAAKSYPAYVEHENVRLFRNDPRIRFVGRVHESVGPSIERSGLRLGRASLLIHHFGLAAAAEIRARKNVLYRELGKKKILEMPESSQAYLELGLVELDNFGNLREAVEHFKRACVLNPHFGVAWFFAGLAHEKLGEHREAIECLGNARKQRHLTSFLFETLGDAYYNVAEFRRSVRAYRQALSIADEAPTLRSKLGLAMMRSGRPDQGIARIYEALECKPSEPEIHDRLIFSLAWLGKHTEAAQAAEQKLRSVPTPLPNDFLRAATLWANSGDWPRSAAMLHVGSLVYPQNAVLKQALSGLASGGGVPLEEVLEKLTQGVEIVLSG